MPKTLRAQSLLCLQSLLMFGSLWSLGLMPCRAFAVDTETLPAHVFMSEFRYGIISGLDQTWQGDGKLYDLGETRSISFDAATLARVSPQAQTLIKSLNYFGSQSLGSQINLGTLNVSTQPQVQYYAPVLAYGITDKWTLGVGVPIVHYTNSISLSATPSNLQVYQAEFAGVSPQLDAAMKIDLVSEANKLIAAKGYLPLNNRDQSYVADIEVALLHALPALGSWTFLHQMMFTLPTGPKFDPDDLMALNQFGRTVIGNSIVAGRKLFRGLSFFPYAGVDVTMPDSVTMRVPADESDVLPDASSKQEVQRWITPIYSLGAELKWEFFERWMVRGGVMGSTKAQDQFQGSGRVDLLAENTDQSVVRTTSALSYSTADAFRAGRSIIPGRIGISVSETVWGRNIQQELVTEMSADLFF